MTLHIVGAGMAGLSAALEASGAGFGVVVHETAGRAGGRCRSWHDEGIGAEIDNGTHMVVGANRAVFSFLERTGGLGEMRAIRRPLPMRDVRSGRSWTASPLSLLPTILAAIPRLAFAGNKDVAACLQGSGRYGDFWDPLAVSVMNTPSALAPARVFRTVVARTLWRSQAAATPYLARRTLAAAFVAPALATLAKAGVGLRFNHTLRAIRLEGMRAAALLFDDGEIVLADGDAVVLAVPWMVAAKLLPMLPELPASPIVNAHFRLASPPTRRPPEDVQGLVGATAHWAFLRDGLLSVTVSAAEALVSQPAEAVADILWRDCAQVLGLSGQPAAVRVVKEKRATLLHSVAVDRQRPEPRLLANLVLAGDWTQTGLPCTLEGAVLSGQRAIAVL